MPHQAAKSVIFTYVRPVHSVKAFSPISVIEFGMVTEFRPEQPANAYWLIDVTEDGITISVTSVPLR